MSSESFKKKKKERKSTKVCWNEYQPWTSKFSKSSQRCLDLNDYFQISFLETPPIPSKMLPKIEIKIILNTGRKRRRKVNICNQLQEVLPAKMLKQPPGCWLLFIKGGICSFIYWRIREGVQGRVLLIRELQYDYSSDTQNIVVNNITKMGIFDHLS